MTKASHTLDRILGSLRRYAHVVVDVNPIPGLLESTVVSKASPRSCSDRDSMWECGPFAVQGIELTLPAIQEVEGVQIAWNVEVLEVSGTIVDTCGDAVAVAAGQAVWKAICPDASGLEMTLDFDGKVKLALWTQGNWPVLCFPSNGSPLLKIASMGQLTCANIMGIKSGWLSQLRIVDSSGKPHLVREARRRFPASRLQRFFDWMCNRRIEVTLEMDPAPSEISLEEMKELILQDIKTNAHFYEATRSARSWRKAIQGCATHKDIIDRFQF
jgi:hypothetical protein